MLINRRNFVLGTVAGGVCGLASSAPCAEEKCKGLATAGDFDVVVVGGSCTGVFAALKAAEAGAKVALVEMSGGFGGTATQGLVPVWHSLHSTDGKQQVIGGLTDWIEEELIRRGEAKREHATNPAVGTYRSSRKVRRTCLRPRCVRCEPRDGQLQPDGRGGRPRGGERAQEGTEGCRSVCGLSSVL